MKLVKSASGKNKIKMSKSEWTNLGKKAGWIPEKLSSYIRDFRDIVNAFESSEFEVHNKSHGWNDLSHPECPNFSGYIMEVPSTGRTQLMSGEEFGASKGYVGLTLRQRAEDGMMINEDTTKVTDPVEAVQKAKLFLDSCRA